MNVEQLKLSQLEKDCLKDIISLLRNRHVSDNEVRNIFRALAIAFMEITKEEILETYINGQPTLDT